MKRFTPGLAIALCVWAGAAPLPQSTSGHREGPHPAIVEKLRDIIKLRQSMVVANVKAEQGGKGESDGRFEIALAEARLQLAQELGDPGSEIAALNDILKTQKHQLKSAETRMNFGAISGVEVDDRRAQILETEIRILRAQQRVRLAE
ncbi:MAG: hypothetical protein JNK85_17845 [Verrucomicrobiales bacterium]|nr:hypothetical protein [Verrucomicrobiales bacterium]